MSAGLPAYPAYRDSKLPWLDEVPAHWVENRGKCFFREVDDRSHSGKEELLSVSHLTGVTPRRTKNVTMFKAASYAGHKLCQPGDVVVNTMWAWMAALGVAEQSGIVSPSYGMYRPLDGEAFNPKYLDYLVRTQAYVSEYTVRSTGIRSSRLRLYPDKFLDIPFVRPPRPEQDQIVAYLRAQDREIARFIRAKRRLIDVLEEQKQTVIHRAVTRGLDPNARLKPSGIDWLGEVPEHWEKIHLASLVRIVNGYPFDSQKFNESGGYPLVRIRDLFSLKTAVFYDGDEVPEAVVNTGDVLVGMDGDFNVAVWKGGRALLNQRVCCLRAKSDRLRLDYLAYLLPLALRYINELTLATTVKHLSSGDIKGLRFPCPEPDEQQRAVMFIREKVSPLDEAIDREKDAITLVREYRDRLIADVVTGQVDVRGWAPPSGVAEDDENLALLAGDGDETLDEGEESEDGDH